MAISSSYILERHPFWLIIHLRPDATVEAVEDHDHYSGGNILPIKNETQEQLFVRRARERCFSLEEIYAFLEASKEATRQKNAPRKHLVKTVHQILDGKFNLFVEGNNIGINVGGSNTVKPWYEFGDWNVFKAEVERALLAHTNPILKGISTEHLKAELETRRTQG